MRILGIDPGSNYLGLGCVEARGSELLCIGHAVIKVHHENWGERLRLIFEAVDRAIIEWQPNAISAEEVFFAKNPQSALKLGQARGAALAAAAVKNLPIFEYPATKVKQAVAASGRADKEQVFRMIKMLLGKSLQALEPLERHDASDALAIAICHLQQRPISTRLAQASQRNKGLGAGL